MTESNPKRNPLAFDIRGLSKQYLLGQTASFGTLRDSIAALARKATSFGKVEMSGDLLWALKDVSFEVPKGNIVGIIGRNGSGKSTLLKILSRIVDPTEGEAEIYGRVAALLEVGTGMHPELTGRENVFLSGSILGLRKNEISEKYDEIVAFSELERFIDTPIKRYSSGMRVRLGFSVSCHLRPENLLIDEILAVGDAAFQKKCLHKMEEIASGGRTILFVTHDHTAVRKFCTRVIWLKDGVLAADGNTQEIVNEYLKWLDMDEEVK